VSLNNCRVQIAKIVANLEMVKAGLAKVHRDKPAGLDIKSYWRAESETKKAGQGTLSLRDENMFPGI